MLIVLLLAGLLAAQEHVGQYSQADVEAGYRLYNSNCITCHGANGDSVPGVNLRSGQFRHASSDADLNRLLQTGIPGTAMPPGKFGTGDLAALVAYLRTMHEFDTRPLARGDAARGENIFQEKGNCTTCHRVNGKGSRTGPDLSDIGAIRSPEALQGSLMDPTASMLPLNRSVRAVTRDGKTITGRRLNEDTYTVQLIDSQERLISLTKSDLRDYTVVKTSPMPSFEDKLSAAEVDDLVAYLRTLKGMR
ncbi:MAG TPA: c-type cytochrome [Terriglobia bacterium]|jgi:putative heme-binding domain-containing protein